MCMGYLPFASLHESKQKSNKPEKKANNKIFGREKKSRAKSHRDKYDSKTG